MTTSETSATSSTLTGMFDTFRQDLRSGVAETSLKERYQTKPITMHRSYPARNPMRWPKVIRAAYAEIWNGKHPRIIIKAPRGGGKSKLLGTVGFDLWYLRDRKVVTMGGSQVQAEIVYGYFTDYCDIHASVRQSVLGNVTASKTVGAAGNEFNCVTASPKQVRGKHPDVLISDETCETSDELIDSALPMVNDSTHPQVIMASTFHKIFGRFAETWDDAEEKGYYRIQWDIFDVCLPFDPTFWDRDDVRNISGIDTLRAFAAGRTGDAEGWIPIENIVQAWREKPTADWFEVEYLGSRPSSAGLILKPEDVDSAVYDDTKETCYNFVQGAAVVLGIDWGFSTMTAVVEAMAMTDGIVAVVDNKNYHEEKLSSIIAEIVKKVEAHGIRYIYADIGSGNFANPELRNALAAKNIGCEVIDVNFGTEKFGKPGGPGEIGTVGMLGNLRAYFEQHRIKMPKRFRDAYYQLKNYRYQEGTDKPVKKDDHIPDALMCALKHWSIAVKMRVLHVQGELNDLTPPPRTAETQNTAHYSPALEMRGSTPITAGDLDKEF
jgi:hypothetical protein